MAFQTAAKKDQARLRRPVGKLLGSYDENLGPAELIENLKVKKASLERRRHTMQKAHNPEYKQVGKEIAIINHDIAALKKEFLHHKRSYDSWLLEVIKQNVSQEQFQDWCIKAKRLFILNGGSL